MSSNLLSTLAVSILGVVALIGFFATKTKGFGKYGTSSLILILVLVTTAILLVGGYIDAQLAGHVLLALAGFAGGLVAGKGSAGDA